MVASLALPCALASPAPGADHAVDAGPGFQFVPSNVTVAQGDLVTWTNVGGFHNVHFEDNSFIEPPFSAAPPWAASRVFDTAGSFRYYCDIHRSLGMTGTIDVTASDAAASGQAGDAASDDVAGDSVSGQGAKAVCASQRRFTIRIRGIERVRVRSAKVTLAGKPLSVRTQKLDGRLRHTAVVDLRGRPRGAYTVAIVVTTTSGEVLRGVRTYRTCMDKQEPARLPRL